jgi:hypothetical protein
MAARLMLHPPEGFRIVLRNSTLDLVRLQAAAGGGEPEQTPPPEADAPAGAPPQPEGEDPDDIPPIIVIGTGTYLIREAPEFTSIDHLLDAAKTELGRRGAGEATFLARIPHAEPLSPEQLKASLSSLPDDVSIIVQLEIPAAKERSGGG